MPNPFETNALGSSGLGVSQLSWAQRLWATCEIKSLKKKRS